PRWIARSFDVRRRVAVERADRAAAGRGAGALERDRAALAGREVKAVVVGNVARQIDRHEPRAAARLNHERVAGLLRVKPELGFAYVVEPGGKPERLDAGELHVDQVTRGRA